MCPLGRCWTNIIESPGIYDAVTLMMCVPVAVCRGLTVNALVSVTWTTNWTSRTWSGWSLSVSVRISPVLLTIVKAACKGWQLWRHDIDTLIALLTLFDGNPPETGGFPSKRVSNAELWCFLCYPSGSISSCFAIAMWRKATRAEPEQNHYGPRST